jgi:hypothetical protein
MPTNHWRAVPLEVRHPSTPTNARLEALLLEAEADLVRDRLDEAERTLRRAVDLVPDHPEVLAALERLVEERQRRSA